MSRLVACIIVFNTFFLLLPVQSFGQNTSLTPVLSILLGNKTVVTMEQKIPSLAFMVAGGTDIIQMAWIPGSDGKTPVQDIQYEIHLSTAADFAPSQATLIKSVTGTSQAEVTGLTAGTLYYGKIIANYSDSTSDPSNTLEAKTFTQEVLVDPAATIVNAADVGLGKHTTSDGITYTYSSGTPPPTGSLLFSEDVNGGTTLRLVISSSTDGSTVTVVTADASLVDVLDRGSIYSSFQLFDINEQAQSIPATTNAIASARKGLSNDGSQHTRIDWKNKLLSAEQTTYAHTTDNLVVEPLGDKSVAKLFEPLAVEESFTATVEAKFEPKLITSAEWGGSVFKHPDTAKVAAQGVLSLTAEAKYNFTAAGSVEKDYTMFERTWVSVYSAGPVPVYQEITLAMKVQMTASAEAAIEALAHASLAETVEVGAIYDGTNWTPYITNSEETSTRTALDIIGKAEAEIRLIPEITVAFYKVLSSNLTVEPFVKGSLSFSETTTDLDFLAAHPERIIQLSSFDVSLGLESKATVNLSALGYSWDPLPETCVLGTDPACLVTFAELKLFSLPRLSFHPPKRGSLGKTLLTVEATQGVNNDFSPSSIQWEVFPDDSPDTASVTSKGCSIRLIGDSKRTTCKADFFAADEGNYKIFVSGFGILGTLARRFVSDVLTIVDMDCGYSHTSYLGNEKYNKTCTRLKDGIITYLIYNFEKNLSPPKTSFVTYERDAGTGRYISLREEYIIWDHREGWAGSEVPFQNWLYFDDTTTDTTVRRLRYQARSCNYDYVGSRVSIMERTDAGTTNYLYPSTPDQCSSCEGRGYPLCPTVGHTEAFNYVKTSASPELQEDYGCHDWWDHYDGDVLVECVE